jgi:hypothetical protein
MSRKIVTPTEIRLVTAVCHYIEANCGQYGTEKTMVEQHFPEAELNIVFSGALMPMLSAFFTRNGCQYYQLHERWADEIEHYTHVFNQLWEQGKRTGDWWNWQTRST